MKDNIFRALNLQLFAEGAGDGGTGEGGATGEPIAAAAVPQTEGVKKNPLANVKYGIQEEDEVQTANVPQEKAPAEKLKDRQAAFEELIKGEYKDLYNARVQDTIQKRLKSTKEVVSKYESLAPALEALAKKYGVDCENTEALSRAVLNDNALYEDAAMELGITAEECKAREKAKQEIAGLRRRVAAYEAKERTMEQYSEWSNQAEEAKTFYPNLDLRTELQDDRFASLLRSNIDVRTAYEVIHKDEIIPKLLQHTTNTVEQKLTNNIIANGSRPKENGVGSQSPAQVKRNVSQLSKEDRAEIIRRVAQGEKIRF